MTDKLKLEVIEWYDHWGSVGGGWKTLDEVEEPKASLMKTIGWNVKENDTCIILTPNLDTGDNDGEVKIHGEQCVLKCAIKSRKRVAESNTRKKLKH